jgi:hypothetical protein
VIRRGTFEQLTICTGDDGPVWLGRGSTGVTRRPWNPRHLPRDRQDVCGKGCTLWGDFTPDEASYPTVTHANIGHGQTVGAVGDSQAAVDVDGHIYPAGGGTAWLYDTLGIALGVPALGVWIWFVRRRWVARRTT